MTQCMMTPPRRICSNAVRVISSRFLTTRQAQTFQEHNARRVGSCARNFASACASRRRPPSSRSRYCGGSRLTDILSGAADRCMGRRNKKHAALTVLVAASAVLGYGDAAARAETLALVGCKTYASPTAAPVVDAVIVASDDLISAVGAQGTVQVPQDARVIDCAGKTVVAGFWNSHVHFTGPLWINAMTASAAELEMNMQEMLTRW